MDEFRKRNSEEIEKDVLFSQAVKAGKRIYYMDVRKTRKDELYLSITESKKVTTGDGDGLQVSFEKHKIFLYREDFSNFIDGLTKAIRYIHENESTGMDEEGVNTGNVKEKPLTESDDLNIEF